MERVCVILGSSTGIRSVLDVIVEKIRDKPDTHGLPSELKVKLVVPQSTASMIVGKGGKSIARIEKDSSARVQLLQQNEDNTSQERVVTVQGDNAAMHRALDMLLERIFSDPLSNSYPNVSYSDAQLVLSTAGGASAGCKLHTGIIPNHPSFAMLRYSLRFCGYSESCIDEVVAAVYTLASYGFVTLSECSTDGAAGLGTALGMAAVSGSQPSGNNTTANYSTTVGTSVPTSADYATSVSGFNTSANPSMPYGPYPGFINSDPNNYGQNAAYQYYGHAAYNLADYSGSSSVPPPPPPPAPPGTETPNSAETTTQSIEVGEHIIGALLGPGGRSITDLQIWSGATVEVSKKGVFAPGTRNRIVTVSGTALAVQSAMYFIKQCIDHEEMRRASSVTQPSPQPPAVPPSDMYSQSWPASQQTAR